MYLKRRTVLAEVSPKFRPFPSHIPTNFVSNTPSHLLQINWCKDGNRIKLSNRVMPWWCTIGGWNADIKMGPLPTLLSLYVYCIWAVSLPKLFSKQRPVSNNIWQITMWSTTLYIFSVETHLLLWMNIHRRGWTEVIYRCVFSIKNTSSQST